MLGRNVLTAFAGLRTSSVSPRLTSKRLRAGYLPYRRGQKLVDSSYTASPIPHVVQHEVGAGRIQIAGQGWLVRGGGARWNDGSRPLACWSRGSRIDPDRFHEISPPRAKLSIYFSAAARLFAPDASCNRCRIVHPIDIQLRRFPSDMPIGVRPAPLWFTHRLPEGAVRPVWHCKAPYNLVATKSMYGASIQSLYGGYPSRSTISKTGHSQIHPLRDGTRLLAAVSGQEDQSRHPHW